MRLLVNIIHRRDAAQHLLTTFEVPCVNHCRICRSAPAPAQRSRKILFGYVLAKTLNRLDRPACSLGCLMLLKTRIYLALQNLCGAPADVGLARVGAPSAPHLDALENSLTQALQGIDAPGPPRSLSEGEVSRLPMPIFRTLQTSWKVS